MTTSDFFKDLEEKFWKASQDTSFYETNVSDQALFAMPFGIGTLNKAQCIEQIRKNPQSWTDFALSNFKSIQPSESIVIVSYEVQAFKKELEYRAMVSTTYLREGPLWKIIFHQQTPTEAE